MHLGYCSTALSALRNHFREAGDGSADLKGTVRTLRQWGIRGVLEASRSAWRYLSRYVVINAATRIVCARVKFVPPQPFVADQKLHVAHEVRRIVPKLTRYNSVLCRNIVKNQDLRGLVLREYGLRNCQI